MTLTLSNEPRSYRNDPAVPSFDDTRPLTVMDGECALCSTGARLIARFDKSGEIRICRAQTKLGRALLQHYGLSADDPESWLYIVDGRAYTSLDAMISCRKPRRRRWETSATAAPSAAPPAGWVVSNGLARNRYRLFRTNRYVRNSRSCAAGETGGMKVVVLGGYGVFGSRLAELSGPGRGMRSWLPDEASGRLGALAEQLGCTSAGAGLPCRSGGAVQCIAACRRRCRRAVPGLRTRSLCHSAAVPGPQCGLSRFIGRCRVYRRG